MDKKRINKYLSEVGFCSRRKADDYISDGRVYINGKPALLGSKVSIEDEISVDGEIIQNKDKKKVYIAFNKPVGIECTGNHIVTVNKKITTEFIDKMRKGVRIMGRITRKCFVKKIHENRFKIILTQGMNRQIRRMCEVLGYRVTKLKRVRIMDIHLDTKVGEYRNLNNDEIGQLFIN